MGKVVILLGKVGSLPEPEITSWRISLSTPVTDIPLFLSMLNWNILQGRNDLVLQHLHLQLSVQKNLCHFLSR